MKKKIDGVRGYNPPDLVKNDSTHEAETEKINQYRGVGKENDKMGDKRFE